MTLKVIQEMVDFLLDSIFCVVNVRMTKEYDNYTCLFNRGSPVVDYTCRPMLVPHSTVSFNLQLLKY